jgi:LysM repeat protein
MQMSEMDQTRLSDEWTKFGVLVIVMMVVVLVVALSRPLIFGVVVPVVMGDGLDTLVQPVERAMPSPEAPAAEEPAEAYPPPLETEVETAAPSIEETSAEAAEESMEVGAPPTPVTARFHVVKTGETLTNISRQYGVAVQSIVNANNLASADRINVGDELTIPQE